LGVLLVCILGVLTWRQAHVYGDQETFWREAATRAPNSWVTHFNLAGAFMQKGRPVEAIPEYRATLQLNPGYARAHHRFGAALLADGKPDEARTQFREALSLDPGFAEAHGGLGDVFLTTEKWEDACREYAVALAGRPDLIKVRAAYAVALTQAGRAQEAVAQYELLLRQLPGDVRSHNNLGRLLAAEGRLAEAVAHYQAALVLAPDSAVVQCNLAWLLACADDARYRRPQEALGLAERACALTQWRDARSLDALAAAEAALGSWPDAVTHAQQAQEFATAAGQSARASRIAKRLELYRGRAAVHLGSKIPLE
jgi:tetratricopeptide (TPR) repeat protein